MKDKKVVKLKKNNFFKNSIFIPFILLITALIILSFSPLFDITSIEVEGNYRVTENSIVNVADIKLGQNILRINKNSIKENIKKIAYIGDVTIRRYWPNTILISVKEKDAIAQIKVIGTTIALDDKGLVLEAYSDNSVIDLPIIDNIEIFNYGVGKKLHTSDDEKINNVLEVLKILKKNDMLNSVERIEQNPDIIIYTKVGHVVYIGDIYNLDYKVKRLKAVISKEMDEKYYFDISNINIYPISKPLWTITQEKQDTEVIE